MYQVSAMLTLMFLLWGSAIYASYVGTSVDEILPPRP